VKYRYFDFKVFLYDDMAISCKNMVIFGPVTLGFKWVKDVHPLVDQQFGYIRWVAPLLDLEGSVLILVR